MFVAPMQELLQKIFGFEKNILQKMNGNEIEVK